MKSKIKWGIIGPGNIAGKFASDLELFDDAEIAAVASRTLEKAQKFADQYNIKNVFDSYDKLFESNTADIVYIATPHNFHKDLAIRAMQSGKHVLCEKPLGINKSEVQELVEVARQNKVFLMEGLWSRFNPSINKVKGLVDEGVIGKVSYIHADFAFYAMDRGMDSRLLNPNLASGSILDIGIYPIFLAYLLLGKPKQISASSNFHPNGTELQTSMIFQYEKAQAILYSGLTSTSEMKAEISGSKGEVFINPRWHEADSYTLVKNEESQLIDLPKQGNGFVYEIEEVHKCLGAKKLQSELWSHQNSLDLAELLDTVREKAGVKFPFEI
ncbi:gfo/Idh/MocA family oxidoreductase [Flagellimonas aquimarina]|uniref:Gfo/Idh/MocA family oxidoreductase n=1 Tax=Flagellimonas aquimarina TaxID=2201895 RepID=A0A316KZQ9_9FLAO|nr:Gfo/Idh/MocA family oxidoreductase [Allomuricauda koreensis]PWL39071.1 gfo/Idh/MocA family oxidoreductase [Allomuricauda koreensis]